MWWTGNRTRLEAIEKELEELRELHRELRDLPVEWQDWLHKIRNVLARLNQRARAAGEDPDGAPAPQRQVNPAALRLLGINGRE